MMKRLVWIVLTCLSISHAQAALFDDKEARKKILEVEQRVNKHDQTLSDLQKNQQSLSDRVAEIEAIVKGQGLVDMLSQQDKLMQEISRLKGELEVVTHNLEVAQQRQKDLYNDTDTRLRKLESGVPNTNTSADAAKVEPNKEDAAKLAAENADFEAAQALSRASKHKDAFEAYDKFLQTYPNSARYSEAQYWLGYSQFSLKNYKAAIATQQKLVDTFPESPRAADALFNIANSHIQLSDVEAAKKTLRILISQYPNSEVIPNAKKRLSVLEAIKVKTP